MKDDTTRITTLEPREQPTAKQIIDELRESILAASAMGVFDRLLRCYNTRRCLWAGQQPDGRLGEDDTDLPVFRWKGAPDLRVPLADKFVRWLSMLRMSVFNRGDMRIGPRRVDKEQSATEMAGVWQDTMDYFHCVQEWNFAKGFELFCTCVEEFGYSLILGDWQRKQRTETLNVTVQQLTDVLLQAAQDELFERAMSELPEGAELDPESVLTDEVEPALVEKVSAELEMMLAMAGNPTPAQLDRVMRIDERMTETEAAKVLRALRKSPGEPAEYFAPKDDGGVPVVEGFVPFVNCLHSHDLTVQYAGQAEFFAVPKFWSESRIRERARMEKWHKAGTETLIKDHKNKFWNELTQDLNVPGWGMMGTGIGCEPDMQAMEKVPRWLVVYVWRRVTNKQGLPMVCRAVVSPHMPDQMLLWETTDLEELPIVCESAEPTTIALLARGVCDLVVDKQNHVKDTLDSEAARGQLGSNPPLLRTGATNVGVKPGIELYAKRSGQSYDGSKFMEVPVVDMGALKVMEKVELLVEQYYFRSSDTPLEDQQLFRESVIFASKRALVMTNRIVWKQVQEHIDSLQVGRINGREVKLDARRDQLGGEADITIGVHLQGYDKDAAANFTKVMGQIMQNDRGGNIDWNEATNIAAQLWAPTYARRLILTSEAASGKVIDDQEMRIAKMAAGVPVRYEDRVSNPGLRRQVLQQWAEMPGNAERAQTDPLFAEMLTKEQEMLDFQEQQQTVNPVIGRTGVKPNQPAAA
jgi:hypothetical protein